MARLFRSDRRPSRILMALAALGSLCAAAGFQLTAFAATAPPAPASLDLHAGYDTSITLSWPASAGASSYDVYRGTSAGGEGSTPYTTTTSTTFKDAGLGTTPTYFYQVSAVNGAVVTRTERFPITGSFDTYQHSFLQVHLNAGVNTVSMLAVSDHGLSRVDQLTVTPATASVPSGPTNLTVTAGKGTVTLRWAASASGGPTSYSVYRGTKSDGEAVAAAATVGGATTTFTDTGLTSGHTYYYNVAANNAVGVSPDSNEIAVTVL